MKQIEFWFDFGSTYSYPAAMRIETLAAIQNVKVLWRPFVLGALFKEQGWSDSPFNLYPAMGKYMWRDMQRTCLDLTIPFQIPRVFPRNGLLASRIICSYSSESWIAEFSRLVFKANFVLDQDIADPLIISNCLNKLSLNAEMLIKQATSSEAKQKLIDQTEQAKIKDIFGAPSFIIGDELFWGNDRLEQAFSYLDKNIG